MNWAWPMRRGASISPAIMQRVHECHPRPSRRTTLSSDTPALGVEVLHGHGRITSPWTVDDDASRWQHADADDDEHRHRRRCEPLRAANPWLERDGLPDQRHGVGPETTAQAPGGAGRRPASAANWRKALRGWAAPSRRWRWRRASWCGRTRRSPNSWPPRCAPTA